jgi:hypothetical protein
MFKAHPEKGERAKGKGGMARPSGCQFELLDLALAGLRHKDEPG